MSAKFQLRCTLRGHEQDVKALAFPTPQRVVSASRDGTVRLWDLSPDTSDWTGAVNRQATGFVNAVCVVRADGLEYIASGGQDCMITLTPLANELMEPAFYLSGHSANVCALVSKGSMIASGSWDCTARIWEMDKLKYTLEGHTASVWAVQILAEDKFLTGSADGSIRLWQGSKTVQIFTGHTQPVRGLCLLPGGESFASCSNDGTVKLWDLTGTLLATLTGHDSFVYSVSCLHTGEIISSGEDRSVRIWQNNECIQAITLPCVSVWATAACYNGDIAVGGSDSTVRVFTRDTERVASQDVLKEFEEQNASYAVLSDTGGIDKSKLSGPEGLQSPGTKEGEVKMIVNSAGIVEAHQWTYGAWVKIGDVTSAAGSDKKVEFEGKRYDYVFDVDIKDDAPPLKLPFNVTDNPYEVAEKFLLRHDLPASYKEDVVRFLVSNTGAVNVSNTADNSAYESQSTGATTAPAETGESAQAAGSERKQAAPGKKVSLKVLPQMTYLLFDSYSPETLKKGLTKLNAKEEAQLTHADIDSAISYVEEGTPEAAASLMEYITKIVVNWAPDRKVIGLDLLRIAVLKLESAPANFMLLLTQPGIIDGTVPNNFMMMARVLANLFTSSWGIGVVNRESFVSFVFDILDDVMTVLSQNEKVNTALATLLLNYVVDAKIIRSEALATRCLNVIRDNGSKMRDSAPETCYRLLFVYGTALASFPALVDTYRSVNWKSWISQSELAEPRFKTVIADIEALLGN